MSSITYQVTLSSDGRPQVSVTSDGPAAARDAIPWLSQTYVTLLKDAKAVPRPATTLTVPQAQAEVPPLCEVHQMPMTWQHGRKGYFWSCHEKLPNGDWCKYRPALG